MCTVTLAPIPESDKGFVLTSNRDEAVLRQTLAPEFYTEEGIRMLYPRDQDAGGTWIGISERKRCICLLNGGFIKHIPKPPYRKSRGVVVKELLAVEDLERGLEVYNLENIEAFTAIIVDWDQELTFLELVWDGKKAHLRKLKHDCHIWSSALLYSPAEIEERRKMFREFRESFRCTSEDLLRFHSSANQGSKEGLIINRGFLKTRSITQILKEDQDVTMWYRDLSENEITEHLFTGF